jgi:hypothetical protein
MKLLSTQNFKTVKGEKFGILTGILYLAPAKLSGFEVCPKRSEGCTASCLYSAGMGAFSNVQKARIQKTLFYFGDRPKFLELIKEDIKKLQKQAKKDGQKLAIRLNGTSDLNWMQHDVFSSFPDVQFYDYTKVFNRLTKEIPSNYHLTFSKSENNDSECIQALKLDTKKGDALPASWNGFPVYDGDDTDTRFLDPKGGYVIGLRAKGQAKKDISGFVVTLNNAA